MFRPVPEPDGARPSTQIRSGNSYFIGSNIRDRDATMPLNVSRRLRLDRFGFSGKADAPTG
jgi:hypothetical protein